MRLFRALWRLILYLRFRIFQRHRFNCTSVERVQGYTIIVLPTVFNPRLFFSTEFLLRAVDRGVVPAEGKVLDLGTGSGVVAVAAARDAREVVAVDVNPVAVRCTRINALLNRVEERVEVRQGDLFQPVVDEVFDLVLFNPPYLAGQPKDRGDLAFRGEDIAARFASGLGSHLRSGGEAFVVLSSRGLLDEFLEQFLRYGISYELAAKENLFSEVLQLFRLQPEQPAGLVTPGKSDRKRGAEDRW